MWISIKNYLRKQVQMIAYQGYIPKTPGRKIRY